MTTVALVIGDDFSCAVELQVDGVAYPVSGTVRAAVVSADHARLLLAAEDQPSSVAGADWSNGVVGIHFTPAQTEAIAQTGPALLEIQIDAGAKATWFAAINIVLGHIA